MKHIAGIMAVLAVLGTVMALGQEAPSKPTIVELTGTIVLVKDDAGLIKAASLRTNADGEAKLIAITLDKNGKALVVTAGENTVKVSGEVTEANGIETITVSKYEVVVEAETNE